MSESSQGLLQPVVSVLILNWNGKFILKNCLDSLKLQTYKNWELVVVDNASTDDSVEIAMAKFPQAEVFLLRTNLGFARGNNFGITKTNGKYVILLNNDTEVEPNFIETLVKEAEKDDSIASVGCKIVQSDNSVKYCPIYSVEGGFLFHRTIAGFLRRGKEYTRHFDYHASVVACVGTAVLYRKSVLERIGMFDPFYLSNWEDNDLGLRMNIAGFKVVYTPTTIVYHIGGASEGSWLSHKRYTLVVRNALITYYKNFELRHALIRTPIVSIMLLGDGLIQWFAGNTQNGTPLPIMAGFMKAVSSFISNFRLIQKNRLVVQQLRKVSDKYLEQTTSIKKVTVRSDFTLRQEAQIT
ncbi:MAG: glycosyltransferase family 2 protein [Nitrososphaerota archaeon]|nr:glycosyltransferase family 2 protein [Nitrososphaerota archaeon]